MSDTQGPYRVVDQNESARNGVLCKVQGPTGFLLTNASRARAEKLCRQVNAAYSRGASRGWDEGEQARAMNDDAFPSVNPYRPHTHWAGRGEHIDRCRVCGKDIRDEIHASLPGQAARGNDNG